MDSGKITTQTLRRLPQYLNYLRMLPENGSSNISATAIAEALGLNDVQVRKDLASVSSGGRPKIGYPKQTLIRELELFLGYDGSENAVIVGVGNLGRALLSYEGFRTYGLNIVAGFDINKEIIGSTVCGRQVLPMEKLPELCTKAGVNIGIITVPAINAQAVCSQLVEGGIRAIWNFAPAHLNVPDGVLVQNENMAASLAVLSKHLSEAVNT